MSLFDRDLRFNNIDDISPETIQGLNNLHTLMLNDNLIRNVRKDAFSGLQNLRILYLYKNQIESIEPGAFNNLPKLEHLYLHHNYLTEIRKGTFINLPALKKLFLQNNDIHRIAADAFQNVGPMTQLQLDSKTLECTCDIVWLIERLHKSPSEESNAVCESPIEMKGRRLNDMSPDEFHCCEYYYLIILYFKFLNKSSDNPLIFRISINFKRFPNILILINCVKSR